MQAGATPPGSIHGMDSRAVAAVNEYPGRRLAATRGAPSGLERKPHTTKKLDIHDVAQGVARGLLRPSPSG